MRRIIWSFALPAKHTSLRQEATYRYQNKLANGNTIPQTICCSKFNNLNQNGRHVGTGMDWVLVGCIPAAGIEWNPVPVQRTKEDSLFRAG